MTEECTTDGTTTTSWRATLLGIPALGSLLRFLSALRSLAAFRAETQQRLSALEQRARALEARAEVIEPHVGALEVRSKALEAFSAALAAQSNAQEARSASLEGRSASLEGRTDAIEVRSTALEIHTAALSDRAADLERRTDALEPRSAALELRATAVEKRTDALEPRSAALEAANLSLAEHARALEAQAAFAEQRIVAQQQVSDNQRLDTSALQAYVTALHADTEALGSLMRQTAADQAALAQKLTGSKNANNAGLPDRVYFELAQRLLAADASNKARHEKYLSYLGGASSMPVLDLGCGRGEWLAYLQAQGYIARGVDLNESMVAKCLAQGLTVSHDDGLTVLLAQVEGSLRAVTALQVVERLPTGTLWQWLTAAWQALAPGGHLIIETPNPENLQVAACSFLLDPQRLEPLPPVLLEFLVRAAGFEIVTLLRHDSVSPGEVNVGRDYAVIATRPEHG